jgi:prolyl oligopeptidase
MQKSWQDELKQLCDDYWQWVLEHNPLEATYLGDRRYDHALPELGAAARKSSLKALQRFMERLQELEVSVMGNRPEQRSDQEMQDTITLDTLRLVLSDDMDELNYGFHQWAIDQLFGPQVRLLELPNYHPLGDEKGWKDLVARYRAVPAFIEQYLEDLSEGIRDGNTAPEVAVKRVISQLEDILKTSADKSPLLPPASKIPDGVDPALREMVQATISTEVYPAFRKLLLFLKGGADVTVAPGDNFRTKPYPARHHTGLRGQPNGDEAYKYRIRKHTTTHLGAMQIHQIGIELLQDIHAEMFEIARELGHDGELSEFRDKIKSDPANFLQTREQLLEGYRALVAEVEALLPQYFGRLPAVGVEVKPIEEFREKDSVAAYYYSPPDDFSRPGIYYANTYQPETRPRYNMAALTVHEAVPGHHLQIALGLEQRDLPAFRRHAGFTAYVEGWALYCERLAVEMGVYKDPLSRFGMLTYQAWRAARLVVDSGIHALGWSRDKAIEFFVDNVGLPEGEVANEVDRYIIWPGQALAYAMGMRQILRLRQKAEAELGDAFDLRAFHDEVLRFGALPLSILDKIIERFIETHRGALA